MLDSTMQARYNLVGLEPEWCLGRRQAQKGTHHRRQILPCRGREYQPIFCWRARSSIQTAPRTHGSSLDGNLGQRHGCSQSCLHCLVRGLGPLNSGFYPALKWWAHSSGFPPSSSHPRWCRANHSPSTFVTRSGRLRSWSHGNRMGVICQVLGSRNSPTESSCVIKSTTR